VVIMVISKSYGALGRVDWKTVTEVSWPLNATRTTVTSRQQHSITFQVTCNFFPKILGYPEIKHFSV